MTQMTLALLGAALITIAAAPAIGDSEIPLADVPAAAIAAAESAVEGFKAKEAEMKDNDGQTVYELEGKAADGKKYDIKVTADGEVRNVEEDD